MNKKELATCREKLISLKKEIQNKLYGEKGGTFGLNTRDSSGDISAMPQHLADIGTDNFDRDFNLDIAQGKSNLLQLIDAALAKIDQKDKYGFCEACVKEINKNRLMAVPYVRLCIGCQEEKEKNKEEEVE